MKEMNKVNTYAKSFLIVLCMLMVVAVKATAYEARNLLQKLATEEEIKQALVMNQKWVPYPAYTDRAGWDALLGTNKEAIIKAGQKYLDYNWEVVKATKYLEYEKSGSRTVMQDVNRRNVAAFSSMLMAELAEGKGQFIPDLINGIFFFSEMTTWAESAHLKAYQKTRRAMPDYREHILELHQGGMAQMLSWTYYFLRAEFDKVDPIVSLRLRHELQERELTPYLTRDDYWWMAFNYKEGVMVNNWNPWCNSNALLCFMLLENNRDTLARAVYRSMVSVDKFINYVKADGACEEGPSYWGHASGKLFEYLSVLSMATAGKISLFNNAQIKSMGEYIANSYIGNEWVANFADASARAVEVNTPLIYRYGMAVNSNAMKAMAAQRDKTYPTKLPGSWMDLYNGLEMLRVKPLMQAEKARFTPADFVWYPQTEFCYIRNNGNFLAAKGGFNNESHNHNDVGTFILCFDNVPVMVDAGVGTYTSKTFSKDRYTIWTMQSNYHNLPMINGVAQSFGATFKSKNAMVDQKAKSFSVDISGAYPKEAEVKSWVRAYQLKKNQLVITDRFDLNACKAPNVINFLTWGIVDTSKPGTVNIKVDNVGATLTYDAATFEVSVETIPQTDIRLSKVWGDKLYRLSLKAKQQTTTGNYLYTVRRTH